MKKIIFLFAILLGFASCNKEVIEPTPNPTAQSNGSTFDKYVVIADISMDSVVFENTTAGTSEVVTAIVSTINCGSNKPLSEFPLTTAVSSGDVCTVTIYHNNFTFGNAPISEFVANSSTVLCDELGGNSGNQTSSGNNTTLNFTVP